ncbi:hypothetical protein AHiyo6_01020 [Arthrobacter sp. Hiyo6]|nr:hypothetical protein AHiyo6_01020 [Arthrobacter sp. Hiyo6]
MITDSDNEFNRANDTFLRIRGRVMSREEFQKNIVGLTWLRFIEVLVDGSQEANDAQHAQEVGQVAVRDNWQGQIGTLQTKVADLTTQGQAQGHSIDILNGELTTADNTIADLNKQIKDLQTAAEAAKPAPVLETTIATTPAVEAPPALPTQPTPQAGWLSVFLTALRALLGPK